MEDKESKSVLVIRRRPITHQNIRKTYKKIIVSSKIALKQTKARNKLWNELREKNDEETERFITKNYTKARIARGMILTTKTTKKRDVKRKKTKKLTRKN